MDDFDNIENPIMELSTLDPLYAYYRIMYNSTLSIDWGDGTIESNE